MAGAPLDEVGPLALLARLPPFASGHQAAISSISGCPHWCSPRQYLTHSRPLLVILNTFGPATLAALAGLLLGINTTTGPREATSKGSQNKVLRTMQPSIQVSQIQGSTRPLLPHNPSPGPEITPINSHGHFPGTLGSIDARCGGGIPDHTGQPTAVAGLVICPQAEDQLIERREVYSCNGVLGTKGHPATLQGWFGLCVMPGSSLLTWRWWHWV